MLIFCHSLSYTEVAQGILFGPLSIHTVGLRPTLLFLAGWRVTPVRAEVCSTVTSRETPAWALSTVQSLARGKDRKRDLGSSPSPVEASEGLPRALQQGEERQRSWELRDSKLVGWEPGTSAPDGPAHEERLLAPRLLQRSPFKGSQPSVVRSLLPYCLFWAGLLLVWGIALAQCAGEVFPKEPGSFTVTLDHAV